MKIITSEAVFKGHPDKICDQISDAILDACLKQDKNSRVALETLIKNNIIVLAGEITTNASVDFKRVALGVLKELGYDKLDEFKFIVEISKQSSDIALGVDVDGAGDQGIMYGYASNETQELMPLPIVLARRIAIKMDELTRPIRDIFGSDGKCQVSVEYDDFDNPVRVTTIVVSQQTKPDLCRNFYTSFILNECIAKVIPSELIDSETVVLINPTGEFVKGGAYADSGLTGRKIICDTYGGVGRHGGGAFSGKDVTKVDRLGAYYARYVAKNIVASGVAKRCEVQVAYAIGVAKPVSVMVDTFGTGKYSDEKIAAAVNKVFDLRPAAIIRDLNLRETKYRELSAYGHMGRTDIEVAWEKTDRTELLKSAL